MDKAAHNIYPVNELVRKRWSPRAFSEKPVEEEKLNSLFEAARWAPSAFNEQPWRFIVGRKGNEVYDKIMQSLVEWNRQWAGRAPVLVLNLARKTFSHNNKPNGVALYDLGQAVAFMILEAVNQGLISHEMSGFDAGEAARLLEIPESFQAVSVTAFGYYGDPDALPRDMYESETGKRQRKNPGEIVFGAGGRPVV
ncbi:MAG: nitroreductase family protein [Bacteroidales bacterium]|nr:nitroreductase family protein [Bacteroidales bacterium]